MQEELDKQNADVTASDIRSIKLNYLQFNKRTAVTAAQGTRPVNNEYTGDAHYNT